MTTTKIEQTNGAARMPPGTMLGALDATGAKVRAEAPIFIHRSDAMPALFPNTVDRPTNRTPAVRELAIDSLLADVLDWLRSSGDKCDSEREIAEVRQQLSEAATWHFDGYQIAKELDRRWHWEADSELVDVLDGWHGYVWSAERKAVAKWVETYDIKPAFAIGDAVTAKWGGDDIVGVVHAIDTKHATYSIERTDEPKDGSWSLVKFEDTKGIAQ